MDEDLDWISRTLLDGYIICVLCNISVYNVICLSNNIIIMLISLFDTTFHFTTFHHHRRSRKMLLELTKVTEQHKCYLYLNDRRTKEM